MRKLIIVFLVLALAIVVFCFVPVSFHPLNGVLLYALEKRLDADIDCDAMSVALFKSLDAEGIMAKGKDGLTIRIKKGTFSYNPIDLLATDRLGVECRLEDVLVCGKSPILEMLIDLLAVESLEDLGFHEIKSTLFIGKNDTIIRNLTGTSDGIRFHVDGVTGRDDSISLRLQILLNDQIISSIPEEIRAALFKKEKGHWESVSMVITGNYKKPSLRLLSENFSLDLKIGTH